jgi:transcriptional antiterminator RfaH
MLVFVTLTLEKRLSTSSHACPSPCWFAVFSKPRREVEAAEQLEQQGFTAFLPRVRARRRLRGQWREVVEPMFPRYLFLRATLGLDDLRPIRSTRGVVGLVRFGGEPRPVPEVLIAELYRLCSAADGALDLPEPLVPGSRVRILEGPFAGYEAELLSQDGEHRARVLLTMLGQSHAVQMPLNILTVA